MHQSADGDIPAVVDLAKDVLRGNAHVTEKNLIEFAFPGHLAQGTNLNPRRFHMHEENRETFVFGNRPVRSNDELAPISHPTVARPYFLPVHHIVPVGEPGFSLQGRKVGARVRFGKALAPNFFRAENLRDEAALLGVRTVSDDRRSDQAETESAAMGGASRRAISSQKSACCINVALRPPYSFGHETAAQPPS